MKTKRSSLKRILLPWRRYKEWREHREKVRTVSDMLLGYRNLDPNFLKSLEEHHLTAGILDALTKMKKSEHRKRVNESLQRLQEAGIPVSQILDKLEDYLDSKNNPRAEMLMTGGAISWMYSVFHHSSTSKNNETYLFDALAALLTLSGGIMAMRRSKWQVLSERLDRLREATQL